MAGDLSERLCALPGVLSCRTRPHAVVLVAGSGTDARLLKARAQVVCADLGESRAVEIAAAPVLTTPPMFSGPTAAALRRADRPLAVATASLLAFVAIALAPSGDRSSVPPNVAQIASPFLEGSPDRPERAAAPSSRTTPRPRDTMPSDSVPGIPPLPVTEVDLASPSPESARQATGATAGPRRTATIGAGRAASAPTPAPTGSVAESASAGAGQPLADISSDASPAAPSATTGPSVPSASGPVPSTAPAPVSAGSSDDSCEAPGARPGSAAGSRREAPSGGAPAAGAKPARTPPSRPLPDAAADHAAASRFERCPRGEPTNTADPGPDR